MRWLVAVVFLVASLSPRLTSPVVGQDADERVVPAQVCVVAGGLPAPEARRDVPLGTLALRVSRADPWIVRIARARDAQRCPGARRSLRRPMRFHGRRIPRVDDSVPRA